MGASWISWNQKDDIGQRQKMSHELTDSSIYKLEGVCLCVCLWPLLKLLALAVLVVL